jgi:hypothetical protein
MDSINFLLFLYVILGFIFIFLNKKIGAWVYKLTLLFTDKLRMSELFIFRIDSKNRDSFFFLTRSFSILFGISIVVLALYSMNF